MDALVEFRLAYDEAVDASRGGSTDEEIDALRNALGIAFQIINS